MASITIPHTHKNLIFAASVANETNATFDEGEQWIIISDEPTLTIPSYCFRDAVGGDAYGPQHERAWRSLLLNKKGYLIYFGDDEITLSDEKPTEKRPSYLLRFDSEAQKDLAEKLASEMGYGDLREYLIAAVDNLNQQWEEARQNG